jgi:dihydrofolate reductase
MPRCAAANSGQRKFWFAMSICLCFVRRTSEALTDQEEQSMRRLLLKISVSIDGFVGGPHGEIDWLFRSLDDAATAWLTERLWEAGLHIMGSSTFRGMKAFYPQSGEPYAPPMNAIPKAYFSRGGANDALSTRSLEDAKRLNPRQIDGQAVLHLDNWEQAQVLTGDLATEIKKLKAQDGKPILAHGGASFARSLISTGLIDEFLFLVHPIALGRGLPIFSGLPSPLDLTLAESKCFPSGVVANTYRAG